ncbi:MAG: hypothetical protein JWL77_3186 [Chthonomonadaceae bacterium]|nr:hypothetical protein [Chthonomonadaceae bacterium]
MSRASIPEDIQQQATTIVEEFNRTTMNAPGDYYALRFKGRFAYLDGTVEGALKAPLTAYP